jgi:hypothetical protein
MEDETEVFRGGLKSCVSLASELAVIVVLEAVVDEPEGRLACSAPAERGLGPGKDPLLPSVAAANTPLIDPLLSPEPDMPLTIDPRRAPAGDGVGVASKDPRLAPE